MSSSASGTWAGACGPSTHTAAPSFFTAPQIEATGRITAVGDVMWLTITIFVRGVTARVTAATTASGASNGRGKTTTFGAAAPTRRQARSQMRVTAPYS